MRFGRTVVNLLVACIPYFVVGFTLRRRFEFASNGVCIDPFYFKDRSNQLFTLRDVPGDGDCMFLAVALAAATSMGLGGNDALLRAISRETREVVAQVMNSTGNLNIEGNRSVPAQRLLQSAAQQEGITPVQYLELLRKEGREGGLYGGGPELAVLSNVLRRPISIYEVDETKLNVKDSIDPSIYSAAATNDMTTRTFPIKCMGVFGDIFADPCLSIPDSAVLSGVQPGAYSWHLHILVLDMVTGEKHAQVLLPQSPIQNDLDVTKAQR